MTVEKPYRHAYSKQKLFNDGNKIFVAGDQILVPRTKNECKIYDIRKLNTHIKSNQELV